MAVPANPHTRGAKPGPRAAAELAAQSQVTLRPGRRPSPRRERPVPCCHRDHPHPHWSLAVLPPAKKQNFSAQLLRNCSRCAPSAPGLRPAPHLHLPGAQVYSRLPVRQEPPRSRRGRAFSRGSSESQVACPHPRGGGEGLVNRPRSCGVPGPRPAPRLPSWPPRSCLLKRGSALGVPSRPSVSPCGLRDPCPDLA